MKYIYSDINGTKGSIPVRFGIGTMRYDYAESHSYLCQLLKNGDPVIIMHKEDVEYFLLNPDKFLNFKTNYFQIVHILSSWG